LPEEMKVLAAPGAVFGASLQRWHGMGQSRGRCHVYFIPSVGGCYESRRLSSSGKQMWKLIGE